MLMPREGSLLLAAFGSLSIVCEPIALSLAWNLIVGINRSTSPNYITPFDLQAVGAEQDPRIKGFLAAFKSGAVIEDTSVQAVGDMLCV